MHLQNAGKRKSYLAALSIILSGYLLFLTSALWFPGQEKSLEYYTPFGAQVEIGGTGNTVSLVYWAYSPSQAAMSVERDLGGSIDGEAAFEAVDRAMDKLPVSVIFSQSGTYALKIAPVPEDFGAVSLRVSVNGDTARLYTNSGQVERVEGLAFYPDLEGYYQARIKRNIRDLEQEMEEVQKTKQERERQIASCQEQIMQAKKRLPYLSRKQREDTEKAISSWENQISGYQTQQEAAKQALQELEDEIAAQKRLLPGDTEDGQAVPGSGAENVSGTDTGIEESEK